MILIRLTEAGKAAYLAEHEHIAAILSQLIDTLGEDEARALTDGINEAVSALEHLVIDNERNLNAYDSHSLPIPPPISRRRSCKSSTFAACR